MIIWIFRLGGRNRGFRSRSVPSIDPWKAASSDLNPVTATYPLVTTLKHEVSIFECPPLSLSLSPFYPPPLSLLGFMIQRLVLIKGLWRTLQNFNETARLSSASQKTASNKNHVSFGRLQIWLFIIFTDMSDMRCQYYFYKV